MNIQRISIKVQQVYKDETLLHFSAEVQTDDKKIIKEMTIPQDDFKSNFDMVFDHMKEIVKESMCDGEEETK